MQTKPKDAPLILDKPMDAALTIPQSWTEYRDESVANAKTLTEVKYPDNQALTSAVHHLKTLKGIIKDTEDSEARPRKTVNEWLKNLRRIRDEFLADVTKEHLRLTGAVNHFQSKADEERRAREREALALQRKAEEETRKAEAALSLATSEDEQLDAQLALESATAKQEQASAQLAVPTDTPKGLTTKVRFDFQIIDAGVAYAQLSGTRGWWKYSDDFETIKFDRAGFLKCINASDAEAKWIPDNDQREKTIHGIRIFRDVSTHTR